MDRHICMIALENVTNNVPKIVFKFDYPKHVPVATATALPPELPPAMNQSSSPISFTSCTDWFPVEVHSSTCTTKMKFVDLHNTDLYSGTDVPSDAPEDEVDSGVKGHHNDLDLYDDLITEEVQQKAESHQESTG
ncbi:hypothetical protein MAR_018502 [Mya arenaria]|uniref:Uncharacterized protein n=1 Tax=Mya arenaria TaxID=6604 RepID=A0ABY7EHL0_MYAAR|nr:hypothetical protein MAR_018502 [Mya arenaria]